MVLSDCESIQYMSFFIWDPATFTPPKKLPKSVYSLMLGTCHPDGHKPLLSRTAYWLYRSPNKETMSPLPQATPSGVKSKQELHEAP